MLFFTKRGQQVVQPCALMKRGALDGPDQVQHEAVGMPPGTGSNAQVSAAEHLASMVRFTPRRASPGGLAAAGRAEPRQLPISLKPNPSGATRRPVHRGGQPAAIPNGVGNFSPITVTGGAAPRSGGTRR
ncbi:hypothetical protein [Stutzerimonas xanthomarina]|uniref:hypothetical protein n=1 Tax=Stutzerimonas xanthomarina TaxID=271420 RepID=UPI003AA95D39